MNCKNCGIMLLGNMKRCPKCGFDNEKGQIDQEYLDRVTKARAEEDAKIKAREQKEAEEAAVKERLLQEQAELRYRVQGLRKEFLSTTGYSFEGYNITEYLGIKSGEIVIGTGVFSEFSASISDMFGIASNTLAGKLTQAKNAALNVLIDNCIMSDANAVIGVDIDIMTIGQNMIVACANGTAVKIEKTFRQRE